MKKVDMLTTRIEDLKLNLENLVEGEEDLSSPEVIKASEALDEILLEYYKIMKKGKKPNNG